MSGTNGTVRIDHLVIADMVPPGAKVLDVGCGDGALLQHLVETKGVDGRGIELSQAGVNRCVARGLAVVQGDADTDLDDYPSNAFDFVVLSQTLQATRNPREVLRSLLRIGRRAVVSFPNFGYWRVRLQLALGGTMPVTSCLSEPWYSTPNIHLCTIRDFTALVAELGLAVERSLTVDRQGRVRHIGRSGGFANLLGEQGVFLLRKGG